MFESDVGGSPFAERNSHPHTTRRFNRRTKERIMIKPRIIVTGATGKTGSVVVTELLKSGYRVRALVRREDGRSARLKVQGAEVAVAEMSDVERIADALKDVQRAYFCPPLDPYMIQGAVAFAVAARSRGSNTSSA
jgi:NAD(P)H dehydrogenase (quinone)